MTGRAFWNDQQVERLRKHVAGGGTAIRAAVIFGISISSVREKARQLGCPFPTLREERTRLNAAMARVP